MFDDAKERLELRRKYEGDTTDEPELEIVTDDDKKQSGDDQKGR